jgi:hypothetical protein
MTSSMMRSTGHQAVSNWLSKSSLTQVPIPRTAGAMIAVGHNLPQKAPRPFVGAIIEVDGY